MSISKHGVGKSVYKDTVSRGQRRQTNVEMKGGKVKKKKSLANQLIATSRKSLGCRLSG